MSKFVKMYNQETGAEADVTVKAFNQVWSSLGWTLTPAALDESLPVEEEVAFEDDFYLDEENPSSDTNDDEEENF